MYSFINKPIGAKKNALNDLKMKKLNYLIAKNNILIKNQTKNDNKIFNNLNRESKIYDFEILNKESKIYHNESVKIKEPDILGINEQKKDKLELNIDELKDVPMANPEVNNQQLFVLKNNIISLINLSCISNSTCKNILDELNSNNDNKVTVADDIWKCVNGLSSAVTKSSEKEKDKKFSINKEKVNKVKKEEAEINKSQLINYKTEMITKVDNIFTKAVDNLSSDVLNDIMEYTNIIIQHSRSTLHEQLDKYLNSFLENIFK